MKNSMKLLAVLLVITAAALVAFAPPPADKVAFGFRTTETLTQADVISLAPQNSLTIYTLATTANTEFDAVLTNCLVGDRMVLIVTADATARTMTFDASITGIAESVAATKTEVFEFIYTGSGFVQLCEAAID